MHAKSTFVQADQAHADPQPVVTAARELGARTVVTTGAFDDLENALASIRDAVPSAFSVLFAPQGG